MNACLQCDEDESGPNFAKFAGRTRRNTGLESAITRPCQMNRDLYHEVCPLLPDPKLKLEDATKSWKQSRDLSMSAAETGYFGLFGV